MENGLLPGVGWWAEHDCIVGAGAGEGAGRIVVGVAIGGRTGAFEYLRVRRWLAGVGCAVRAAAAVLRVTEGLAGALAGDALAGGACHLQRRRAEAVQVHPAARAGAVVAGATLRHHQHWEVVPVHQAHVVEVHTSMAVQGELCQGSRRRRVTTGTFHLPGAAIAGDTCKFPGGVLRTVSPPP